MKIVVFYLKLLFVYSSIFVGLHFQTRPKSREIHVFRRESPVKLADLEVRSGLDK